MPAAIIDCNNYKLEKLKQVGVLFSDQLKVEVNHAVKIYLGFLTYEALKKAMENNDLNNLVLQGSDVELAVLSGNVYTLPTIYKFNIQLSNLGLIETFMLNRKRIIKINNQFIKGEVFSIFAYKYMFESLSRTHAIDCLVLSMMLKKALKNRNSDKGFFVDGEQLNEIADELNVTRRSLYTALTKLRDEDVIRPCLAYPFIKSITVKVPSTFKKNIIELYVNINSTNQRFRSMNRTFNKTGSIKPIEGTLIFSPHVNKNRQRLYIVDKYTAQSLDLASGDIVIFNKDTPQEIRTKLIKNHNQWFFPDIVKPVNANPEGGLNVVVYPQPREASLPKLKKYLGIDTNQANVEDLEILKRKVSKENKEE